MTPGQFAALEQTAALQLARPAHKRRVPASWLDVAALCAEVRRLQAITDGLAERVAHQSHLLSRNAERRAAQPSEGGG